MADNSMALLVPLLAAVGAAVLTHIFASHREAVAKRREILSFLRALDWQLQVVEMKAGAGNVTEPLSLGALGYLIERGLVGWLPKGLLSETLVVDTCLAQGNEFVALVWKLLDVSAQRPGSLPPNSLDELRSQTREWFSKAVEHVGPARQGLDPFIADGIRPWLWRRWWWMVQVNF